MKTDFLNCYWSQFSGRSSNYFFGRGCRIARERVTYGWIFRISFAKMQVNDFYWLNNCMFNTKWWQRILNDILQISTKITQTEKLLTLIFGDMLSPQTIWDKRVGQIFSVATQIKGYGIGGLRRECTPCFRKKNIHSYYWL